jgi:hypothetical protein
MSLSSCTGRVGPGLRPGQAERGSAFHYQGILLRLQEAARVLLATLREIFDESAYARFLARHGLSASQLSYAAFLSDQEGIKARRPRCC